MQYKLLIGGTITRAYLISLGFDITTITFMFSRTSFEDNDNVVFVMPKTEVPGKTNQTISAIEELLEGIKARGVKINYSFIKVQEEDFSQDLIDLLQYTIQNRFSEIEVWALGGTRSIVSLLSIYSVIDPRVTKFFTYSESNNKAIKVPRLGFIDIKCENDHVAILKLLRDNGSSTIKRISDTLGFSQTKTYRLINRLKRMGLIDKLLGRKTRVRLNNWGRLYLKIDTIINKYQ